MKDTNLILRSALAGLIAAGMSAAAGTAVAAAGDIEHCYGVAKAGKNDCGTARSACASSSKADRDPNAWVALPKGTCEKIVGGRLASAKEFATGSKAMEKMQQEMKK